MWARRADNRYSPCSGPTAAQNDASVPSGSLSMSCCTPSAPTTHEDPSRQRRPQYIHNFAKQNKVNTTYTFDYDYKSVMHYGSHFFSSSRDKPTIVPKVEGVEIGQRRMLSKTDCLKVNQLYGCLDKDAFSRAKY
ncbi:Astacin-like metalloendopeptidase, partial [Penaeus vannamei]